MDLRTEILNLKTLLSITDLPTAVDNIIASLDAAGILNAASLLEHTREDLASLQEHLSVISFDREVQAAVDRLDFAEVARLKNSIADREVQAAVDRLDFAEVAQPK